MLSVQPGSVTCPRLLKKAFYVAQKKKKSCAVIMKLSDIPLISQQLLSFPKVSIIIKKKNLQNDLLTAGSVYLRHAIKH